MSKTYTELFIDQVLNEADIDNDGQISFEDFLTAFQCHTKNEVTAMRQLPVENGSWCLMIK